MYIHMVPDVQEQGGESKSLTMEEELLFNILFPQRQRKGEEKMPKNGRTGTKTAGKSKKPKLSQQRSNQKKTPKNKRTGVKRVQNSGKPRLSQQNKAPAQISKKRKTATESVRSVKKPRLALHQNRQNQVPKQKRVSAIKTAGQLKKAALSLQRNCQQQRPKQKRVATIKTGGGGQFRRPTLSKKQRRKPWDGRTEMRTVGGFISSTWQDSTSHEEFTSSTLVIKQEITSSFRASTPVSPYPDSSRCQSQIPGQTYFPFVSLERIKLEDYGSEPQGYRVITPSSSVSPARVKVEPSGSQSENRHRTGFDRQWVPKEILDMADLDSELFFVMAWEGTDKKDLVPTKLANERCPQLVIKFYESRLTNVYRSR